MVGLGYGLAYSLAFGATAWGYDTWVLARSQADLAWAKLGVGLPILLLIGAVTGTLTRRSDKAGIWAGVWSISGALSGAAVGVMPSFGYNLATWIVEPRLRGADVYPIGTPQAARVAFVVFVAGCMGSAAGLVGHHVARKARRPPKKGGAPANEHVGKGGRGSPPSAPPRKQGGWAAILLCLPLAMPSGLLGDEMANRPVRVGQWAVHRALSLDSPPAGYTLHLVDYDLRTQEQETGPEAIVDAAFDDGMASRCQVSGRRLEECWPISPQFEGWMEGLIQEGLEEDEDTGLERQADRLSVDAETLRWIVSQRASMSEEYEILRDTQCGGWILMSARFDTGYVLTCYFHGDSPVVLERCEMSGRGP
jgi:hypothetical protein